MNDEGLQINIEASPDPLALAFAQLLQKLAYMTYEDNIEWTERHED